MIWKFKDNEFDLSREARIMGILNVTPDSFSDGGQFVDQEKALQHAHQMIADGASIIDIGGESTRPGASETPADEEIERTIPVIKALRKEWDGAISIDTKKAAVAEAAIAAGAEIVNDISGLRADRRMPSVCANSRAGVVVMHMRGTPKDMQDGPKYANVVKEIRESFLEQWSLLPWTGIQKNHIVFDPGIGFGKSHAHNCEILRNLHRLSPDKRPILLGISRKSYFGYAEGIKTTGELDLGTVAMTSYARSQGVMLHRVHDVRPCVIAIKAVETMLNTPPE